jgi:hypothetical protein
MMTNDADAREINAEPWDPPPGMDKLRCERCRYYFATADAVGICPDCAALGIRGNQPTV